MEAVLSIAGVSANPNVPKEESSDRPAAVTDAAGYAERARTLIPLMRPLVAHLLEADGVASALCDALLTAADAGLRQACASAEAAQYLDAADLVRINLNGLCKQLETAHECDQLWGLHAGLVASLDCGAECFGESGESAARRAGGGQGSAGEAIASPEPSSQAAGAVAREEVERQRLAEHAACEASACAVAALSLLQQEDIEEFYKESAVRALLLRIKSVGDVASDALSAGGRETERLQRVLAGAEA